MGQLTKTTAVIQAILDRIFNKTDEDSITGTNSEVIAGYGNTINGNHCMAGGIGTQIIPFAARGLSPGASVALGNLNEVYSSGMALGQNCVADGILATSLGSASIASGNDSICMGNTCATGRRQYTPSSHGADSLHSLGGGNLGYFIIANSEGDVSTIFPATEVDNVPTSDQKFRLHPYCIIRAKEDKGSFYLIKETVYTAGAGTKVWYNSATDVIVGNELVLSSYAPLIPVGFVAGNSQHAEGRETSAVGYMSHSEGYGTRAWAHYSHAQGFNTSAIGENSHSEGNRTIASGAESHAMGRDSKASLPCQLAHGSYLGKFNTVGDAQYTRRVLKKVADGVGWHDFVLLITEYGRSYVCKTQLVGRQYGGTVGMIGESAAYNFNWMVARGSRKVFATTDVDAENNTITVAEKITKNTPLLFSTTGTLPTGINYAEIFYAIYVDDTTIKVAATFDGGEINLTSQGVGVHDYSVFNFKTTTKELIGRTFVADGDAIGDGLTTGIMASFYTNLHETGYIHMRLDGLANRNLYWVATTEATEVAF